MEWHMIGQRFIYIILTYPPEAPAKNWHREKEREREKKQFTFWQTVFFFGIAVTPCLPTRTRRHVVWRGHDTTRPYTAFRTSGRAPVGAGCEPGRGTPTWIPEFHKEKTYYEKKKEKHIYIYSYIYICICVCTYTTHIRIYYRDAWVH